MKKYIYKNWNTNQTKTIIATSDYKAMQNFDLAGYKLIEILPFN